MTSLQREHYTTLLDRLEKATQDGFYLEASWVAYAIMEDRLLSSIKLISRPIEGIEKKICFLLAVFSDTDENDRSANNGVIYRATFNDIALPKDSRYKKFDWNLLQKIHCWKSWRNNLLHNLYTNEVKDVDKLGFEFQNLANEGIILAKFLSNQILWLKEQSRDNRLLQVSNQEYLLSRTNEMRDKYLEPVNATLNGVTKQKPTQYQREKQIEFLAQKIEKARSNGYHLEATWLIEATIEYKQKTNKSKWKNLSSIAKTDLKRWKEKRNKLAHALGNHDTRATNSITFTEILLLSEEISNDGITLLNKIGAEFS